MAGSRCLTDEGVRALVSNTNFTSFNLIQCLGVTEKGERALAPLTNLTSLDLIEVGSSGVFI